MNACNYDWPREGPIAIARPRREAGRRPNRACAVCALHHQLAELNPINNTVQQPDRAPPKEPARAANPAALEDAPHRRRARDPGNRDSVYSGKCASFLPRRRFARESRCERPEARARAVFTLPATHTTTRYGSSESAATRPSGPSHQGHRKWACSRGPVLLAVGSLRWPAAQQERRQSKVTGAGTCAPGLPTHYVTSEARNA